MNRIPILICVTALAVAPAAAQSTTATPTAGASADELIGLWKAKRRFGADVRGPLVIRRTGTTYTADMIGRALPVRTESGELSFALPGGQGAFHGKLHADGRMIGAWAPPGSPAMGGRVSPVELKPDGANRWSGEVVPFNDTFTFYLLVDKRSDGSLGALLRNPERDFGAWLGVDRLVREGNVVKLFGKRPGQQEEREVSSGTFDKDQETIALDFPGRGGFYEFTRDGDDSDFYPRGKHPARYVYHAPLKRDDGWPTATLEEAGIDRTAVEAFIQSLIDLSMDSLNAPQIHGVLIARHGKLVLEEYFHGEHRDKLHETRSAAKSLTATLVGAAMHAGAPLQLSTPVYKIMNGGAFPTALEPRKRAMTLENLLTMSSGYFCDDSNDDAPGNENNMEEQQEEPDYYRFTLKLPMAFAPGEKAIYCSINPNLALGVMSRATGESPLATFERLIGRPMKITRYGWPSDRVGHPYGGGGVQLLLRDFAKLGQLMLNGGTWEGRRILDRDFVTRASSPLYKIGERGYGFLWWSMDYKYENRVVHTFQALGTGGQMVTVIPELDLVIANNGGNYSSRGWRYFQYELIPKAILPGVRIQR